MHKALFVLAFVCGFSTYAESQVAFDGGVTFGGIMSQVQGDGHSGFFKIGATGGGFVDLGFSRSFSVKLEILYSQKGSRNRPDSTNVTYYKLKLDYLEIPLTAKWRFTDWSLDAGLHYSTLINSSEDFGNGKMGINPPYNSYDLGGHFGGTYYFSEKVNINIRYAQSIVPIREAPEASQNITTWDDGGFNYAIQALIGVAF